MDPGHHEVPQDGRGLARGRGFLSDQQGSSFTLPPVIGWPSISDALKVLAATLSDPVVTHRGALHIERFYSNMGSIAPHFVRIRVSLYLLV